MATSSIWERIAHPSGVAVTPIEIQQFEAELGFSLPEDYRNFVLTLNGGKVLVDHELLLEGLFGAAFVHYLYPFSKPSPFIGIKEARKQQECSRLCLRQAIEIGGDLGTGSYFIILDGSQRGAVYFIYNDDRDSISKAQWEDVRVRIPKDMVLVAPDFGSLGEAILANAKWETEDQQD
jgi:hypothetical protein